MVAMAQKTTLLIPEHFDALIPMYDDAERIEYLRSVAGPALREVLRMVFDPSIEFDTPIPEYKPDDSPLGLAFTSLYTEYRRFYLFQKTAHHITIAKKQSLLAQILESVHATEAMLIEKVFAKDLSDYDLTEDLVRAAFPTLLPERVVPQIPVPVETKPVEESLALTAPEAPKKARKRATTKKTVKAIKA